MNFFIFAILPIFGSLGKIISESDVVAASLPVVQIPDGKVAGTDNFTVDQNISYHAFRGIPYAQPPLGDLRFATPLKNSNWSGFWDGTEDAEECVQGSGENITGSEDCLYINVYTPSLTKTNIPVMVYIHGGAFTSGSSKYESFGPDYFVDEEVIFVSFNYRLGIFGFLSTEDSTASGNWGLKDQVLALQWVKDNIEYFGGDPNKITISGESAGGVSVSYLLQIPKAQGLFNAAIMQSGTSEMLWALNTRARQTASQVGTGLGIIALSSSTLVSRLRNVDAYTLQDQAMTTFNSVFLTNPLRGLPFSPVVEVSTDDAVFTQSSDDYLKSGQYPNQVPVLIGHNSNEAGIATGASALFRTYLLTVDVVPGNWAPFSLTSLIVTRTLASMQVRTYYFGLGAVSTQIPKVVQFLNTDQFNRGTRKVAENIAPFVPVYFYVFGYEGQVVGDQVYTGVGHGEGLTYLFRSDGDFSSTDVNVRSKFVRIWTNFVKTFNPTPTTDSLLDNVIWPTVDPSSEDLDFAWINETISLDTNPDQEGYSFYKDLFSSLGDGSYTTY